MTAIAAQTQTAALPASPALPAAATAQPNVFTREDTMFGVCQALGEDFGFNPVYLRIAFAAPLIWYPTIVLGAYAAAALLVLVSRLLVRNPRPKAAAESPAVAAEPVAAQETQQDNLADTDADAMAVAA
jgi:phage shock protein C